MRADGPAYAALNGLLSLAPLRSTLGSLRRKQQDAAPSPTLHERDQFVGEAESVVEAVEAASLVEAESVARAPDDRVEPHTRHIELEFDQEWYNHVYGLRGAAVSGFPHYVKIGARIGYSPNATFDEEFYLSTNPDVAKAVRTNDVLSGFDHFVRFGRTEGRYGRPERKGAALHLAELGWFVDERWYNEKYGLESAVLRGVAHYLESGIKAGYSPNSQFDEGFYLAFYADVREAVRQRRFACGYEHYLRAGRHEGRLPKHKLEAALDLKYPGLTDPIGIPQAGHIDERLAPLPATGGGVGETFWILVPVFDPDIFFGGYKALIELIVALRSRGKKVSIVVCDSRSDNDAAYARHSFGSSRVGRILSGVPILNRHKLAAPLRIAPSDKIIAYSAWEAHIAHALATHVDSRKFAWLVQEYEPIFHDYGVEHVVTSSAYDLPHFPIFNSLDLRDYFEKNRLGIFAATQDPKRGHDYAVFEHVLTNLDKPTAEEMRGRSPRRFVLYARPESHARRNLFPIAFSALREALRRGVFEGAWEFHGVGALKPAAVRLDASHEMRLHAKMEEPEYRAFMRSADVGLSLMYAPHPGLLAYEMASVGARVVTNVFQNRGAVKLQAISENIIPCLPTAEGVRQAIAVAVASVDDIVSRRRGMTINRPEAAGNWDAVFDDRFFSVEMSGYLGGMEQEQAPPQILRVATGDS